VRSRKHDNIIVKISPVTGRLSIVFQNILSITGLEMEISNYIIDYWFRNGNINVIGTLVDIEINVFEGTNFLTFELINAFDGTL
jgi:hypothetical protein